jgi:glutathione S-transferase
MVTAPEAAPGLKKIAADRLQWLSRQTGGDYPRGARFTLADILLFCFLEFGATVGLRGRLTRAA